MLSPWRRSLSGGLKVRCVSGIGCLGRRGDSPVLDGLGRAYVTGKTLSASTFPTTTNAYDGSHNGGSDAFLSTIGPSGNNLPFSSFLGGLDNDTGYGIKLGHGDVAYLTGRSNSADFPTTSGSFDPIHNGDYDVFLSGLVVPITSRSFLPRLNK